MSHEIATIVLLFKRNLLMIMIFITKTHVKEVILGQSIDQRKQNMPHIMDWR
jgi:hypothetical protein